MNLTKEAGGLKFYYTFSFQLGLTKMKCKRPPAHCALCAVGWWAFACSDAPCRFLNIDDSDICDILSPYRPIALPRACDATVYRPSVCPSVTFRYSDHIGWNTSKIISPPNSDKIVMWRFLRNRRLIFRLHTIFRSLIHWAHRAVIFAVAWLLFQFTYYRPKMQRKPIHTADMTL